jgi:hypothetical protein
LNSQQYQNQVNALLGGNAHVEVAWTGDIANFIYCSKEKRVFVIKQSAPQPPAPGSAIVAAAMTLGVEQFVMAYPDVWLAERDTIEKLMLKAAIARASVWNGNLHSKNLWLWGVSGVGKSWLAQEQSPMTTTLRKSCDGWWDGYSLALTNGVIVENYPPSPQGERLASELAKWGDRYPFVGSVKGSTLLVDPGRFTLIVTSNYSIDQCFRREEDRAAIHARFQEIEMTAENQGDMLQQRLDRSILRV